MPKNELDSRVETSTINVVATLKYKRLDTKGEWVDRSQNWNLDVEVNDHQLMKMGEELAKYVGYKYHDKFQK